MKNLLKIKREEKYPFFNLRNILAGFASVILSALFFLTAGMTGFAFTPKIADLSAEPTLLFFILLLLLFLFMPIFMFIKHGRKSGISVLVFGMIFLAILIFIIFLSTNSAIVDYTDYQRSDALRNAPLALQLYFDKHGQYPDNDDLAIYMEEGTSCVTAQGQANLFEVIGASWLTDPDQGRTYQYGVNKDGATEYVLVATFDSQKRIPVDDLDGIIFGCDCNGLNYCVGKFETSN